MDLHVCPAFRVQGEVIRDEPGKPGGCWDVRGFAMPCSGFARLHCGIGVIPREGVAINLLHCVVIISVKLLQKLTVLCVLILFKSKYKNNCSKVRYKWLLGRLLFRITHGSLDSSPACLLGHVRVSVLRNI